VIVRVQKVAVAFALALNLFNEAVGGGLQFFTAEGFFIAQSFITAQLDLILDHSGQLWFRCH